MNDATARACLFCNRDDQQTPLVALVHRGAPLYICPQHLPVLIHDPQRLVGMLPGAEQLAPAEHHD